MSYIELEKLGEGGSGSVSRVMTSAGDLYALKNIYIDESNEGLKGLETIKQEIEVMKAMYGRNITMDLIDYEIRPRQVIIIMQLAECDLKTFIYENPTISEHRIASILEDMCTTLNTFHQAGYIHGDIKP